MFSSIDNLYALLSAETNDAETGRKFSLPFLKDNQFGLLVFKFQQPAPSLLVPFQFHLLFFNPFTMHVPLVPLQHLCLPEANPFFPFLASAWKDNAPFLSRGATLLVSPTFLIGSISRPSPDTSPSSFSPRRFQPGSPWQDGVCPFWQGCQ